MRYYSRNYTLKQKSDEDLGIDLHPDSDVVTIPPMSTMIIGTGVHFEFPIFGRVRRFLTRIIFGMEITGLGGIVKPRSGVAIDVLAGVIDPGYRGEIRVLVFNPTELPMPITGKFVQLYIVPTFHMPLEKLCSKHMLDKTKRNESGGIHVW